MRKSVRFLAVGLAASLLLSAGAYAAPDVEKRREDAQRLYTGLKENHPNLFANTLEVDFLAKLAEIEGRAATVSGFADIPMFFAYYVPALNWAAEQGIVLGDGAGSFRPADPVSEAERNLMAQRAAALAG